MTVPRRRRRTCGAAVLVAVMLLATACGEGADSVQIAGSSTVGPITELVAEDFSDQQPGVVLTVEITGTGGGFKDRFCTGETAVNNASRQIKDSEKELCAENGIDNILELKVAIDGITTLTSAANTTAPACLGFPEMYALVGPEAGGVSSWADAAAMVEELGGHATGQAFEDVPLVTAGPGTESGTYDSFFELAIEDIAEERGVEGKFRPDWTGNNDDNVIIQAITGNEHSFGWVGYAFYTEVADRVRAFEVADEDGTCIAPTEESIATGAYPLSRDLFIYVNLDALDEPDGPGLAAFIDAYLSDIGRAAVAEAGYVPLTDEAWNETRAAWEARVANV